MIKVWKILCQIFVNTLSRRLTVVYERTFASVVCLFLKTHSSGMEGVLEEPERGSREIQSPEERTWDLEVISGEPGRCREIPHISWTWWLSRFGKKVKSPGGPPGLWVGCLGNMVPWPRQQIQMKGQVWGRRIEVGLHVLHVRCQEAEL